MYVMPVDDYAIVECVKAHHDRIIAHVHGDGAAVSAALSEARKASKRAECIFAKRLIDIPVDAEPVKEIANETPAKKGRRRN